MNRFHAIFTFLSLLLLDFYFKTNIAGIGEGSINRVSLVLFVAMAGGFTLLRAVNAVKISVRRSTMPLFLFLGFYVFRLGYDFGTVERIGAFTFGTTGGLLLFYLIGNLVYIITGTHTAQTYGLKYSFPVFLIIYSGLSCFLLLDVFFQTNERMRTDIFLIEELDEDYQRPGDFLIISYLVYIVLFSQFMTSRQSSRCTSLTLAKSALIFMFLLCTATSIIVAQMIGSNKAAVLIGGLGLITLTIMCTVRRKVVKSFLSHRPLSFGRLVFGPVPRRLMGFGIFVIVITSLIVLQVAKFLKLDLTKTRLGGFGTEELSSLSSRIELFQNFTTQFAISPLFGNMTVDCLTTGCGTYVHSLLASLLTHTGIVGSLFFVCFLVLACKETFILRERPNSQACFNHNVLATYRLLFFGAIMFIAVIGTFFSWVPLWFAIGFFFPALSFNRHLD